MVEFSELRYFFDAPAYTCKLGGLEAETATRKVRGHKTITVKTEADSYLRSGKMWVRFCGQQERLLSQVLVLHRILVGFWERIITTPSPVIASLQEYRELTEDTMS